MTDLLFALLVAMMLTIMFWPFIMELAMLASLKVTVKARLVSKRSFSVRHLNRFFQPYLHRSSRCGAFSRSTGFGRFFGTFLTEHGEQIELQMYLERFRELNEGDEVEIVYKKRWLVSFTKLNAFESNNERF
jgi:hypothetical protein